LIKVKLILKYESSWFPRAVFNTCLREIVAERKVGVSARVFKNRLLIVFRGSKPSKVAERIRSVLGLVNMVEQAIKLVDKT